MDDRVAVPALLVYDGECGFCAYWVRYWERLTGEQVRYAPFQEAAAAPPEVPPEAYARAIHLFERDGKRTSGAEAAFRLMALVPGRGAGLFLYRHLPGFARVAEATYALIARHRALAYRGARLLWGRERVPPTYQLTSWLFLRLLGLIYLAGFLSLLPQIQGLVGSDGIIPLSGYLAEVSAAFGRTRFWHAPTLFWLNSSDPALIAACILGAGASVLIALDRLTRPMLALAFLLYLSLWVGLPIFGDIQSDAFLLEVGFLAIFLTFGSRIVVWLYRWLLFRFMLGSGLVKLLTHDASWAHLTALEYHYQTQPLPTPLAWYAFQLPVWFQELSALAMFGIELGLPLLIFMPRRLRFVAAGGFVVLQVAISLTGNYHFLNLLTICLCLFLLDDRALANLAPVRLAAVAARRLAPASGAATRSAAVLASVLVVASVAQAWELFGHRSPPQPFASVAAALSNWGISNTYGFFGVINTRRPEIIIEGSRDDMDWRAYGFRYKPGDPHRCPTWSVPHQPRLDWSLWFAAGKSPFNSPWLGDFLYRLLEGSPAVVGLLAHNPFPHQPPQYVRALLYQYRFTTPAERAATGNCWSRTLVGPFTPPLSLDNWDR
jgi:predicted DCC family thiol-disulfide oxidoreductase YuxK